MLVRSLEEIDFEDLCDRRYCPSPSAWEDQVLYYLLVDRFSDGREQGYNDLERRVVTTGHTPLYDENNPETTLRGESDVARGWVGGNLRGLTSKIGYLRRLGITTIWISPILKQAPFRETYDGSGTQDFLDIDPHYGTHLDLQALVREAHAEGMYVILDIILKHAGDVYDYKQRPAPVWNGQTFEVRGFRDRDGNPTIPFPPVAAGSLPADSAVWPVELQSPDIFKCAGRIQNWQNSEETYQGDIAGLKGMDLGSGPVRGYHASPALCAVTEIYKFWIGLADVDGYRIPNARYIKPGALRYFTSAIHEFAQSVGKDNFYLTGRLDGDRTQAFRALEEMGLDAVAGIADIPDKISGAIKGHRDPRDFFSLFRHSLTANKQSHTWFRNRIVTALDDYDCDRDGIRKARFCAGDEKWRKLALCAIGMQVTTLGIPSIYYGAEQYFDGQGETIHALRETMFGGGYGAFRSRNRHFFNESTPLYRELSKLLRLRKEKIALRRGRQYMREVSLDGENFRFPHPDDPTAAPVISWSRLFNDNELLLALNTNTAAEQTVCVIIDHDLHEIGRRFKCLYSTNPKQRDSITVVRRIQGNAKHIMLTIPPAGFVVFEQC